MKPGPRKWVLFDGETIIGRVYDCEEQAAIRCARLMFPELEDTLRVKFWEHTTNKQRKKAKKEQLIRPEIAQKLVRTANA